MLPSGIRTNMTGMRCSRQRRERIADRPDRPVAEFHPVEDVLVFAFRALDADGMLLGAQIVEEHRVPAVRVGPATPVVAQVIGKRCRREPADDLEPKREPWLRHHTFALVRSLAVGQP